MHGNVPILMQRFHDDVMKHQIAIQRPNYFERVSVSSIVLLYCSIPRYEAARTGLASHSCHSTHKLNDIFEGIHEFPHYYCKQCCRIETCNETCIIFRSVTIFVSQLALMTCSSRTVILRPCTDRRICPHQMAHR